MSKVDLDKLRSLNYSSTTQATRRGHDLVKRQLDDDKRWYRDREAYIRLRNERDSEGRRLQPPGTRGAARLEATADTWAQVEGKPDIYAEGWQPGDDL